MQKVRPHHGFFKAVSIKLTSARLSLGFALALPFAEEEPWIGRALWSSLELVGALWSFLELSETFRSPLEAF
eukprot:14384200-Alexandrium_andersonii.AAC.1